MLKIERLEDMLTKQYERAILTYLRLKCASEIERSGGDRRRRLESKRTWDDTAEDENSQ